MEKFKHTPGPWKIKFNSPNPYWKIISETTGYVLGIITYRGGNKVINDEANAKLIAAAPELLEACIEFVRKVESGNARSVKSYAQMKAAIAKATGEIEL